MNYCKKCRRNLEIEKFPLKKNGKPRTVCEDCKAAASKTDPVFQKLLLAETNLTKKTLKDIKQCMEVKLKYDDNKTKELRKAATEKDRKIFKKMFPNDKFPRLKNKCLCGEDIIYHYLFMDDKGELVKRKNGIALVLGSVCRNRGGLSGKKHRKCTNCDEIITRKKDVCAKCEKEINNRKKMKECKQCGDLHKNRVTDYCNVCKTMYKDCPSCDMIIKKKYQRCYDCYLEYCKRF